MTVYLYAVPTILYLISVCLFIVRICNRRQQTVSNAYHSSAAYERSTGDPAIGHGFGAAALRSNASHLFTSLFSVWCSGVEEGRIKF